MDKRFDKLISAATSGNVWKKLTNVSVGRGKTAFPKASKDLKNLGVRLDYDGHVDRDGMTYNKFQMQPNAGKIPSTIKDWRDKNGGTHAVMTAVFIKDQGTKDDVKEGIDTARKEFFSGDNDDNK